MVRRRSPGSALALSGAPSRTMRKTNIHPSRRGEDAAPQDEVGDISAAGWAKRSVPTIQDRDHISGGHGARGAFAHPTIRSHALRMREDNASFQSNRPKAAAAPRFQPRDPRPFSGSASHVVGSAGYFLPDWQGWSVPRSPMRSPWLPRRTAARSDENTTADRGTRYLAAPGSAGRTNRAAPARRHRYRPRSRRNPTPPAPPCRRAAAGLSAGR